MLYFRITQIQPNEREIRHKRKQRRKVEKVITTVWLVFLGFCIGITPYCFSYAEAFRGYKAIGSEVLVPLFPFLLIPFFNALCDLIINVKGWGEE